MPSSSSCLEQAVLTAVYLRCPSLKLLLVLIERFYSDLLAGLHPGLLRTITDQIHLNVKDFFLLFFAPHNGNLLFGHLHKQNVSQNVQKRPKHSASFF